VLLKSVKKSYYFLILVLLLIFLFPIFSSAKKEERLNVLLITIDTLRADYLGCYGNGGIETPFIDKLAAEGILFKRAFAHNVVTLPSHINILTGTYPLYHGVRDNSGFRLDEKVVVLSEILKGKNYRTAAFIGAFPLDDRFGLNQGFELYDDFYGDTSHVNEFAEVERSAEKVISRAQDWIDRNKEELWFCWIHLYDPHYPYNPPQRFKDKYPQDYYAGEVAYTDSSVGQLFQFMKSSNIDKKTLVILTSDHGESLGAHLEKTHGIFAYNETLYVPLIFYQKQLFSQPKIIHHLARHIDIVPTVLDVLNINAPQQVQGVSLVPLIENPKKWKEQDSYFESMTPTLTRNWAPLDGIISENYKYIDLPLEELYSLELDFQEEKNLAATERSILKKLSGKLERMKKSSLNPEMEKKKRVTEDPETMRKLRSLGYLSRSGSKSLKRTFTEEDDPKRLIGLDNLSDEATGDFLKGYSQLAVDKLKKVIDIRPDFTLAYSNLAFIYHEKGELQRAIELLERAVGLGVANSSQMAMLGIYLQEAGEFQKSLDILEPLVEEYPYEADALNNLAITYWRLGRYREAEQTFAKLLSLDPGYASAYNNLGSVYLGKKEYDEAIKQFNKAIEYDPNLASPYNGLGVAFSKKGEVEKAIANWKKAVELSNTEYDALYNLGTTLIKRKRLNEAIPYLEKFIALAPRPKYADDVERIKEILARLKNH
jgi:arylsulfatase A-like enzyme/Tfp pilus assembly protein PilF